MKSIYYLLFFCCLSPAFVLAQNKSLDKLVQHVVKKGVDFEETPGVVIGIIDKDDTYIYGFGETKKGSGIKPDGNTIYEIGSVTKAFTASLLTLLEHKGDISYQDTVGKFFPELQQPVTLHDLATHSSGFPRLPHNLGSKEQDANQAYAHYTRDDLLEFLQDYILTKPIGEEYNYSHCGYALLTEILETHTGQSYDELLQNYLFNSLKMNDTRVILNKDQQTRLAQGYSLVDEVPAWTLGSFEGSFGLKSTANDLLKFLSMHLKDQHRDLENILRPNLQRQFPTTRYDVYIGKGWHILHPRKRFGDVCLHSGITNGYNTYISFVPDTHTAVVVLGNSKKSISEVGMTLLQTINFNWRAKKARASTE